jgi:hypothetical protein
MVDSPEDLKARADDGDIDACFKYACLLDDGREVPCDPTAAASYFQYAVENSPAHGPSLVRYAPMRAACVLAEEPTRTHGARLSSSEQPRS